MAFWEWAYDNNYANKEDLKRAVLYKDITANDYYLITNELYTA
ncbi:XkdX family protein [Metabacillus fastidiosus]